MFVTYGSTIQEDVCLYIPQVCITSTKYCIGKMNTFRSYYAVESDTTSTHLNASISSAEEIND